MSYVIDIFSLDTNKIIFDVNADSWLSHVGEHYNPPTPVTITPRKLTVVHTGVLPLHYARF